MSATVVNVQKLRLKPSLYSKFRAGNSLEKSEGYRFNGSAEPTLKHQRQASLLYYCKNSVVILPKNRREKQGNLLCTSSLESPHKTPMWKDLTELCFTNGLDMHDVETIEQAQTLATEQLWIYNNERPNTAVGGMPPSTVQLAA